MDPVKPGDLVSIYDVHVGEVFGVVLSLESWAGCFRDTECHDQVMKARVLFSSNPPLWLSTGGRIVEVVDAALRVIR